MGRAFSLCPGRSDVNLLCYIECVVNLDTDIADCALNLGVTEQHLHRAQVASALVTSTRQGAGKRLMSLRCLLLPLDARSRPASVISGS